MKGEDIKDFFQFLVDNIISIKGQTLTRSNKDNALNYQIYYGNYLITFRFIGAFYLADNILRIKVVDMNTIKVIAEENIQWYEGNEKVFQSVVEFLKSNNIEFKLKK